jgi:ATP-dependent RNA helicase DeaD
MTNAAPTAAPSFEALGIDEPIRETLAAMGFAAPMEVQSVAVRPILEGRDVLVQARTGSGKTAAFAIPFAQALVRPGERGPQALVLEPTRELAVQVALECGRIGAARGLQVAPIYGGAPIGPQRAALVRGLDLIVGTPGRVLDHLGRGSLRLDAVRTVVLDEGDEMLSRGFLEDIERILAAVPDPHQTLLFSATVPDAIARLAQRHQREALRIDLSGDRIGAAEVQHAYYLVTGASRPRDLVQILEIENPDSALIFCNTRDETSSVAAYLQRHGLDAEPISSDLTQSERERVMGRMKEGTLRYLVATDVAARGIDITALSLVVNYTFPESPDGYVHRTGRTGRAGRAGLALSLVSPRELGSLYYLKLVHKIRPEERHLPSEAERRARREGERFLEVVGRLPAEPDGEFCALARRVWQSADAERIVAGLLQRFFTGAQPPPASPPRTKQDPPKVHPAPSPTADVAATAKKEFWEQWAEAKGGPPGERESAPQAPHPEPVADAPADESQMVRLYFNVGRKEDLRSADLVALLREAAGVSRQELGRVQVRDNCSYVSVRPEARDRVIQALHGRSYRGRALVVEPARR